MLIKGRATNIVQATVTSAPSTPVDLTGKTVIWRFSNVSGNDYIEVPGVVATPSSGVVTATVTQANLEDLQNPNQVRVSIHVLNSSGSLYASGKGTMEVSI